MKKLFTKIELVILTLILLIIFSIYFIMNLNKETKSYSIDLFYMDTYINIKIYEDNEDILNQIDKLYEEYHQLTDRYNAYEGLVNVYYLNNTLKPKQHIKIDKKLYDLLQYSKTYYNKTDGNVNIALGNVIDVWKSYRDGYKEGIPTLEELEESGSININDIVLEFGNYLKKSDVKIDLGTVAKGYVTNLAATILKNKGIDKFIINAGGNVIVGNHYNDKVYKVGITNPIDQANTFMTLNINNSAIVSSGGYERFYEYDNKKYHHIIDPKTLFPTDNNILAVTIISNDSGYADLMSTYFLLITYEEGLAYVDKYRDLEVIWYMKDNTIKYTDGAIKYVNK